jgi:hypothetical protein
LIVKWAKIHFRVKGQWPSNKSGPVIGAPGEDWQAINKCLCNGYRGLAGGSSLARLLVEEGLKRPPPPLTIEGILTWAAAERQETGKWPTHRLGPVRAAPGEKWSMINLYLRHGGRGLAGGCTLARLLQLYRHLLLRAHWLLPIADGPRIITTVEEWVAVLVSRGGVHELDVLKSLRERQKKFQQAGAKPWDPGKAWLRSVNR